MSITPECLTSNSSKDSIESAGDGEYQHVVATHLLHQYCVKTLLPHGWVLGQGGVNVEGGRQTAKDLLTRPSYCLPLAAPITTRGERRRLEEKARKQKRWRQLCL